MLINRYMSTLTTNKNFLSPVGFQFSIDRDQFANVEYFCTAVNLPGINLGNVDLGYRGGTFTETGDRLEFSELSITFNVTEDMDNYLEITNWMHRIVNQKGDFKSDATLLIMNSHNNIAKEVKFNSIFPISISELSFDTAGDVEYLKATVSFQYTTYEFK